MHVVVIGSDGMVSLAALRWLADQDASFSMLQLALLPIGVPGNSVFTIVLIPARWYRPAAASIIVVCLTLGNVFYSQRRFLSPYRPLHELVVPKRASTAFLLIPGMAITPHKFLKATAVARRSHQILFLPSDVETTAS